MLEEQLKIMHSNLGFIAALDQSGGSTPKALANYGVFEDSFKNDDEMFELVHKMRTRIIKSKAFNSNHILGAILFENTMDRKIDRYYTANYLWKEKGILPFLKIDKGLADIKNGVRLMNPILELDELLKKAQNRNIFGTKMRSVIYELNDEGIKEIVKQQFLIAKQIIEYDLVPIIEPEVDINAKDKKEIEDVLLKYLYLELDKLPSNKKIIFKLTIPSIKNLYYPLISNPKVLRVVALSGGYSRNKANRLLAKNKGLIASFSRALLEGLNVNQTDLEFDKRLEKSIKGIYKASIK